MRSVDHDGRTTAYRSVADGEGSTVCYVHGSGATHRVWAEQYAPDGPGGTAAALDLSGHGESGDVETEPGTEALAAYAADLAAVTDASDAVVLAGHSLGGAVVLRAVLDGRVEPDAIVLAGTGAKLAVAAELRRLLTEDFDAAVDRLHGSGLLFHDADAAVRERSTAAMHAVGRETTRRDFLTCHAFDVRDRLDEVAVPTLALCGERDGLTPPAYHEYLAEHVRDGRAETVPDAAHLAMVERPDAFNAVLASFLDAVRS